jgi:hypothetical protein
MSRAQLAARQESGGRKATRFRGFPLRSSTRCSRTDRLSRSGLLLAALILGSVAAGAPPQQSEPEATLAAHREHARLVFDRLPGVGAAELAPGWLRWPGAPLELRAGGRTVAALRRLGPGAVEAGAGSSGDAPATSRIEPSWDDGAIHLILYTANGSRFETGFFERVGAGAAPERLNRLANSIFDVRGTYQAVLRDPSGTSVGWLRVVVDPLDTPVRSYEGVLPSVAPELAAAAALALDSEIDWIEEHAPDIYRGS